MDRKLFRRKFCRKIVAPVAAAMSCVSVSNVSRATDNFDLTNVTLKDEVANKFKITGSESNTLHMKLTDFCSKVLPSIYVFPSSRLKAIEQLIRKQKSVNAADKIRLKNLRPMLMGRINYYAS